MSATLRRLAVFVTLLAVLAPAGAQDVASWFSDSSHQASYGSIRAEMESLAAGLAAANLPDSLLASRLEEGARKRVPPERLIAALRDDAARLTRIAATLRTRSLLPQDRRAAGALAERYQLLLRAGADFADLESALDRSISRFGANRSALDDSLILLANRVERGAEARPGDSAQLRNSPRSEGTSQEPRPGGPGGQGQAGQGQGGQSGQGGQGQGGKRGR